MKFKVYTWNSVCKDKDYSDFNLNILPTIELNMSYHNFLPDENCSYKRQGRNFFLMFSWLFWGITFDLRTGIDTGINSEDKEELKRGSDG
jgi:hypothetical protein